MPIYPPNVNERFRSPRCAGSIAGTNAAGTSASFQCGCFTRMGLAVEIETKIIRKAGFQSNGCGYMIAAADRAAEELAGRDLTELHALNDDWFMDALETGEFPSDRKQCMQVVLEAVRAALADHRVRLIEEYSGEKVLLCTCFGISEEAVEKCIAAISAGSVDEVTAACRAGSGCGSCRMMIQEMIDACAPAASEH